MYNLHLTDISYMEAIVLINMNILSGKIFYVVLNIHLLCDLHKINIYYCFMLLLYHMLFNIHCFGQNLDYKHHNHL